MRRCFNDKMSARMIVVDQRSTDEAITKRVKKHVSEEKTIIIL